MATMSFAHPLHHGEEQGLDLERKVVKKGDQPCVSFTCWNRNNLNWIGFILKRFAWKKYILQNKYALYTF